MQEAGTTQASRTTLLLVEDDPSFCANIRSAFVNIAPDWTIEIASTGSDALDILQRKEAQIGLALVDLGLPDISGVEVIRALNQVAEPVPTLVLSVITAERSLIIAIEAGARGYLLKSDPGEAIERGIRDVLEGNYPISPALARYLVKRVTGKAEDGSDTGSLLSPQQTELLHHLAQGCNYREAADAMGVQLSTVQTHIRNLYRKLNAHSKTQALARAREQGLL